MITMMHIRYALRELSCASVALPRALRGIAMAMLGITRVPTMRSMRSVDSKDSKAWLQSSVLRSQGSTEEAMSFAKSMARFMQRVEKQPEPWRRGEIGGESVGNA